MKEKEEKDHNYPRSVWCPINRQYFTEISPGKFRGFPRMSGKLWEIRPGRYRDFSLYLKKGKPNVSNRPTDR